MQPYTDDMEYKASRKYGSMIRAYERFKQISTNAGSSISLHASRDAADDFFQHCYHLKNFLRRDPATRSLRAEVENFVKSCKPLALIAVYCNSFKHGGPDNRSSSGETVDKTNVHTKFDITPQGFVATSRLAITISGNEYDAFSLATDCMKAWEGFLASHGIKLQP